MAGNAPAPSVDHEEQQHLTQSPSGDGQIARQQTNEISAASKSQSLTYKNRYGTTRSREILKQYLKEVGYVSLDSSSSIILQQQPLAEEYQQVRSPRQPIDQTVAATPVPKKSAATAASAIPSADNNAAAPVSDNEKTPIPLSASRSNAAELKERRRIQMTETVIYDNSKEDVAGLLPEETVSPY